MRLRPIHFLLLAVFLLAALVIWPRHTIPDPKPGDAFRIVEEGATLPDGHYLEDHVRRVWKVEVDVQQLQRDPPKIHYSLPDGVRYRVERHEVEHSAEGDLSWSGKGVALRVGEDSIGGTIYGRKHQPYRLLEGETNGIYYLLEIDGRSYPSESFDVVWPRH